MEQVKIYSYKKCSTCIKALNFLDKKHIKPEVVDITLNPPSRTELELMLDQYGGELKKLFNTSGVAYREQNIKEKLPAMTPDQALSLLSQNGRLVKRPFVLKGQKGLVGFKEDEWKKLF